MPDSTVLSCGIAIHRSAGYPVRGTCAVEALSSMILDSNTALLLSSCSSSSSMVRSWAAVSPNRRLMVWTLVRFSTSLRASGGKEAGCCSTAVAIAITEDCRCIVNG